jgi:hypothetical protein
MLAALVNERRHLPAMEIVEAPADQGETLVLVQRKWEKRRRSLS